MKKTQFLSGNKKNGDRICDHVLVRVLRFELKERPVLCTIVPQAMDFNARGLEFGLLQNKKITATA